MEPFLNKFIFPRSSFQTTVHIYDLPGGGFTSQGLEEDHFTCLFKMIIPCMSDTVHV